MRNRIFAITSVETRNRASPPARHFGAVGKIIVYMGMGILHYTWWRRAISRLYHTC